MSRHSGAEIITIGCFNEHEPDRLTVRAFGSFCFFHDGVSVEELRSINFLTWDCSCCSISIISTLDVEELAEVVWLALASNSWVITESEHKDSSFTLGFGVTAIGEGRSVRESWKRQPTSPWSEDGGLVLCVTVLLPLLGITYLNGVDISYYTVAFTWSELIDLLVTSTRYILSGFACAPKNYITFKE